MAAVTTAKRGEVVVYFDSTNAFNPARLQQLMELSNFDDSVVSCGLFLCYLLDVKACKALLLHDPLLFLVPMVIGSAGCWFGIPEVLLVLSAGVLACRLMMLL